MESSICRTAGQINRALNYRRYRRWLDETSQQNDMRLSALDEEGVRYVDGLILELFAMANPTDVIEAKKRCVKIKRFVTCCPNATSYMVAMAATCGTIQRQHFVHHQKTCGRRECIADLLMRSMSR